MKNNCKIQLIHPPLLWLSSSFVAARSIFVVARSIFVVARRVIVNIVAPEDICGGS